jgi:hypothetical protein
MKAAFVFHRHKALVVCIFRNVLLASSINFNVFAAENISFQRLLARNRILFIYKC